MKGFTLIETLIYIAISSFIFVGIMSFSSNIERQIAFLVDSSQKERTADLIFRSYDKEFFICNNEGTFVQYGEAKLGIGERWKDVYECSIELLEESQDDPAHKRLTFYINSKKYFLRIYE